MLTMDIRIKSACLERHRDSYPSQYTLELIIGQQDVVWAVSRIAELSCKLLNPLGTHGKRFLAYVRTNIPPGSSFANAERDWAWRV